MLFMAIEPPQTATMLQMSRCASSAFCPAHAVPKGKPCTYAYSSVLVDPDFPNDLSVTDWVYTEVLVQSLNAARYFN